MTNFGNKDIDTAGIEENKKELDGRFAKTSQERNDQQKEGRKVTCPHCY